jgi:catechol 2,3-dioxygenase-like lactoylglutathione lyase family enzyme
VIFKWKGTTLVRLNHVALTVLNRDISAAFYGTYFGLFERIHDDEHLLILSSGDGSLLALSHGKTESKPPRSTHFGFEAKSAAEVRMLREMFKRNGVEEAEWQEAGPVRVQVFDPDGYRVEAFAWD